MLSSAVLALAALLTSPHVWGEPGADKAAGKNPIGARIEAPPARPQAEEPPVATQFSDQPVITFTRQDGTTVFGLQVKSDLKTKDTRPLDLVVMIDTSASQIRSPLTAAREIAKAAALAAGASDRVAVWTVNVPAATNNLTKGLKEPKSSAVKDAFEALQKEVPFGATDLKTALERAIASFDGKEGRRRAVVFLGNGMSVANPLEKKDLAQLRDKLVAKEIGFFPIPLGPRTQLERGSPNLHGLATGTGGRVVRHLPAAEIADTARLLHDALEVPVFYTSKTQLPAEVTEFYPTKLPPLRSDVPTLVVGKLKPTEKLSYTIEGKVAGQSVKRTLTEKVPGSELDHFFLLRMVKQWAEAKDAADKELQAPIQADRALAMAFEQNRLFRDDLKAQAQWALTQEVPDFKAARDLFAQAKDIDPNDVEVDAGMKIVDKLKAGVLTTKQLRDALSKPTDPGIKIEKGHKITKGQLMALADDKNDKMPADRPVVQDPPINRDDFLRQEKARLAVEEQRIAEEVNKAERRARQILASDPDAAHDLLKRTLTNIRENPDLSAPTKGRLTAQLENSLRTVDTEGARIKQDLDLRMRLLADAQRRFAIDVEREKNEEILKRKMQAFNGLMNVGRFEEAYREAHEMAKDQINKGLPVPSSVIGAYNMGLTTTHVREVQEVKRASQERYLFAMLEVDQSAIPFPDEPPVQFPPAAVWRKLTERRKGVYDSTGLGEDDATPSLRIKKQLSRPINLPDGFPAATSLQDALDYLSEKTGMTFVIDSNAFVADEVQKPAEAQIELRKMMGVSLNTVLRLLLGQVKGQKSVGTFLIRRDYIEVTTSYQAAAEKTVRAYPVADLVIPIPNSINQQALQQNLSVNGQFVQQQNPFLNNPGALNPFNPFQPMQPFNPAPNPFQFNPQNQPGVNQFGNLGGQFGFQGGDDSRQLMELITRVVAPGEWAKLGEERNPMVNPFNPMGGPVLPPNPDEMPTVDRPLLNGMDYFAPSRALVVRGSAQIHTRFAPPTTNPKAGPPPAQGALNRDPDGAIVIGPKPKDPKNPDVKVAAAGGEKPPAKKPAPAEEIDAKKVWEAALAQCLKSPKGDHIGIVIACADFLVEHRKYDHAVEFLKANLRLGIVDRPWVYEALALALQMSNGSPEDIERAQVSAIDVEPRDAQGYLRAANAMLEAKNPTRALAFCKQAALMQPAMPEAYSKALVCAEVGKDSLAMSWAASNLLQRDWPVDNDDLHARARESLTELARVLEKDNRKLDAQRMQAVAGEGKARDLAIVLTWQEAKRGEADLDLKVKEPIGSNCSYLQRQSMGGGTLLGDSVTDGAREIYVASEAFSGEYEITVDRVRGLTQGNKATIEIIRHQGTPNEARERKTFVLDRTYTLKVNLKDGRRTSVASATPASMERAEKVVDDPAGGDRVLNKLRAMTDPMVRDGGLRGSLRATGVTTQAPPTVRPNLGQTPETMAWQAKVPSAVGADIMTQSAIDPVTGKPGLKLRPVFQTSNRPAPLNSPLLPGGN